MVLPVLCALPVACPIPRGVFPPQIRMQFPHEYFMI